MTWTVCVDCGEPAPATRCNDCGVEREARVTAAKGSATSRGYGSAWQRLSARARKAQPFCLDCSTTLDLTADHKQWPATKLEHVDVVCRPCNSKRGASRGAKVRGGNPEVRSLGPVGKAKFPSHTEAMPSRRTVYGLLEPARHRAGRAGRRGSLFDEVPCSRGEGDLLALPVDDDEQAGVIESVAGPVPVGLVAVVVVSAEVQGECHARSLP